MPEEADSIARREAYANALISEIRIMIRSIANDPEKRLTKISVAWREKNGNPIRYDYPAIVDKISQLGNGKNGEDLLSRIGILQAFKDELIDLTKPATGLSIAYTALITSSRLSALAKAKKRGESFSTPKSAGKHGLPAPRCREFGAGAADDSTEDLANDAYGDLVGTARKHRFYIRFFTVISILLAMFAFWEGTRASIGRALLQELEPLRAQQTLIATDKFKLESSPDREASSGQSLTASMLPLCLRYKLLEQKADSENDKNLLKEAGKFSGPAQIREVCGRDAIVGNNFELVHGNFKSYIEFWPDLAGEPYSFLAHFVQNLGKWIVKKFVPVSESGKQLSGVQAAVNCKNDDGHPDEDKTTIVCGDLELIAAPNIQTISNYTLPFIFGVIGSLLYVLVHHYSNIKMNTLFPRDSALVVLRVILGVVVAACISLLISAYAGPTQDLAPAASGSSAPRNLVQTLTLSASGITFLAGFGAEAVFTLLEGLVARVFSLGARP